MRTGSEHDRAKGGGKIVSSGTKTVIVENPERVYERGRAPKRTCELGGSTIEPGEGGKMVSSDTKTVIVENPQQLYEKGRAPKRTCELGESTIEPREGGKIVSSGAKTAIVENPEGGESRAPRGKTQAISKGDWGGLFPHAEL